MPEQAEIRYAEAFRRNFAALRDECIALYGTGQYTEWTLRLCPEFKVVAVMDQKRTGETVYGIPVLTLEEVTRLGCRTIIIVSNLSVAPEIYERIRPDTEQLGVCVYYLNGLRPKTRPESLHANAALSAEDLFHMAMRYQLISFDLFDTLLVRKCILPESVFEVMCRRLDRVGETEEFQQQRRTAEKRIYQAGNRFFHLNDIYDSLACAPALDGVKPQELLKLEKAVEYDVAEPIDAMSGLMRKLTDAGKKVVICSDMYLGKEFLSAVAKKCGLPPAELIVSCDVKAQKHDGSMFAYLKTRYPSTSILHIGDNPHADVAQARSHGIDALWVPNALKRMDGYACMRELPVQTADDRVAYFLLAQRLMSRSLFDKGTDGRIGISDGEDIGYLVFGPLSAGYLGWLMRSVKARSIDHLLFVSRDGYLFHTLYQQYKNRFNLPDSTYFLTSRRCASIASIRTEADVDFILRSICASMGQKSVRDVLKTAFGLEESELREVSGSQLTVPMRQLRTSEIKDIFMKQFLDNILRKAHTLRTGYGRYLHTLLLQDSKALGMMNFVGRGVTQNCLQRLLKRELTGFYFAVEYETADLLKENSFLSWYPEPMSTHTSRNSLFFQYLQGEAIYSADTGTLLDFFADGTPLFDEPSRHRVSLMKACHRGIAHFLNDLMLLGLSPLAFSPSIEFVDRVYGLLSDPEIEIIEALRTGFLFEDIYRHSSRESVRQARAKT